MVYDIYFLLNQNFNDCFDLLGRIGNLEEVKNVVADAAERINRGEVEPNKIGKTVLVIDEAQDMSAEEYTLVKALMANNEEMRVIAVGDVGQEAVWHGREGGRDQQAPRRGDLQICEGQQHPDAGRAAAP